MKSYGFVSGKGIVIGRFVREDESMAETIVEKPARAKGVVYSSPKRVLVRSLRMSRDRWKEKYTGLQRHLKRFRVQAYDACQSRDGWRERAEAAERELEQYKSQAALQVAAEQPPPKTITQARLS